MSMKVANVMKATATERELLRDIAEKTPTPRKPRKARHEKHKKTKHLLPFSCRRLFRVFRGYRRLRSRHASGGTVRRSDRSKPCAATGSVAIPPPLPTLPPP